jgi:hypothetical protein
MMYPRLFFVLWSRVRARAQGIISRRVQLLGTGVV